MTPNRQQDANKTIKFEAANDLAKDMIQGGTPGAETLFVTPRALDRLRVLKSEEDTPDMCLRITVLSGGCSGFQYKFSFDNTRSEDDLAFSHEEITILTDEVSFDLIQGVILDYVQELIGAAFTLKNPNASVSCGCGNSFAL